MSQTPPNSGWQGGPQGPGQQWNPGPPQGPPNQNFSRPQQPQQGYGQQPQQGWGQQQNQPTPPSYPQQGGQQQNYGQQQGWGQQNQQGWGQQNQQGFSQNYGQGSDQSFGLGGAPAKPKSKAKVIVAGAVGVAVLAAGAGGALWFFRGGATPAAAAGLPATVTFATEINLAPAAADQLALKSILDRYPSLEPSEDFGTDYKHALYATLTSTTDDAPDYETEIKPWLGDSIAIGSTGSTEDELSSEENAVVAIQTTDTKLAKEFAEAEFEGMKVDFIDDLMIITDADSDLTVDEIRSAPLSDSELYKADMAKLGSGSLISLWLGPDVIEASLEAAQNEGLSSGSFDPEAMRGAHGALGFKAAEDKLSIEARFATPNAPEAEEIGDVSELAAGLSDDSLVAFAGGLPQDFSELWELTDAEPSVKDSLSQFGIDGPDDLSALLGDKVALTLDWDDHAQLPILGSIFESNDPARQSEILGQIDETIAEMGGAEELEITQQDDRGVVAFGQSADELLNPDSKLGDLAAFKSVVSGKAQAVLFINLDSLKSREFYQDLTYGQDEMTEVLAPMTAIGLTANASDGGRSVEASIHVTFG